MNEQAIKLYEQAQANYPALKAQLSAWIRADNERGGFVDIPVLLLRPQLNFSPYYFAPEADIQIFILYIKAGYAFPWGKTNDNYPLKQVNSVFQ